MTLKELEIGAQARIEEVKGEGALRQHLLDMGLLPGALVKVVKYAPMGDPVEVQIHGYELTLRLADAEQILVKKEIAENKKVDDEELIPAGKEGASRHGKKTARPEEKYRGKKVEHPGLGEGGKYHVKKDENPLPEGTKLTFALAGNQNCGKTTLFNQLTGSNQHVVISPA